MAAMTNFLGLPFPLAVIVAYSKYWTSFVVGTIGLTLCLADVLYTLRDMTRNSIRQYARNLGNIVLIATFTIIVMAALYC